MMRISPCVSLPAHRPSHVALDVLREGERERAQRAFSSVNDGAEKVPRSLSLAPSSLEEETKEVDHLREGWDR